MNQETGKERPKKKRTLEGARHCQSKKDRRNEQSRPTRRENRQNKNRGQIGILEPKGKGRSQNPIRCHHRKKGKLAVGPGLKEREGKTGKKIGERGRERKRVKKALARRKHNNEKKGVIGDEGPPKGLMENEQRPGGEIKDCKRGNQTGGGGQTKKKREKLSTGELMSEGETGEKEIMVGLQKRNRSEAKERIESKKRSRVQETQWLKKRNVRGKKDLKKKGPSRRMNGFVDQGGSSKK